MTTRTPTAAPAPGDAVLARLTPVLLGPVAITVALVGTVSAVVGHGVAIRMQTVTGSPTWTIGQELFTALAFLPAGGFLLRFAKARWVASVLFASGLTAGVSLVLLALGYADLTRAQRLAVEAGQGVTSTFSVLLPLVVLPQVFPDGPLPGRRWRRLLAVLLVLVVVIGPALVTSWGLSELQLLPEVYGLVTWDVFLLTLLLGVVLGCWSLVVRWRRSGPAERRTVWLYAVANLGLLPVAALFAAPGTDVIDGLDQVVAVAGPLVIVAIIVVTVLRTQLYDIRVVVRRAAVYAILAGGVVLVFVATSAVVVVAASELLDRPEQRWLGLAGATVGVLLLEPVRRRLQTRLERRLLGSRNDPLAVLGALRDDVAVPDATIFAGVVRTVAQAVRSPSVVLLLRRDGLLDEAARTGPGAHGGAVLELLHRSESLGELRVAPRTAGERFTAADRRLLDQLVRQIASLVYARRRDLELAGARRELLEAVVSERARLGRDLHDGLAPTLAGAGLAAEALRLDAAPGSVGERDAARLAGRLRAAATDLRRMAHDLQPVDLDLGLAGALRRHLEGRATPGGPTFACVVETGPLPAAVEQAAYLVVLEAVENVVRHAGARRTTVEITADDAILRLLVADDGVGLPEPYVSGLGIGSMRRRVESLGGTFVLARQPSGGTAVRAELPTTTGRGHPSSDAEAFGGRAR